MKNGLLICSLLFSCSVYAEPNELMQQFLGEWRGLGAQDDGSQWSIRLNISADGYFIDYPSLNCGGIWTLIKTTEQSFVFKETLNYGQERCTNHGQMVINKVADNKARYYWFHPNNLIGAVGHLKRQSP
jgi:hypothetical protein